MVTLNYGELRSLVNDAEQARWVPNKKLKYRNEEYTKGYVWVTHSFLFVAGSALPAFPRRSVQSISPSPSESVLSFLMRLLARSAFPDMSILARHEQVGCPLRTTNAYCWGGSRLECGTD